MVVGTSVLWISSAFKLRLPPFLMPICPVGESFPTVRQNTMVTLHEILYA